MPTESERKQAEALSGMAWGDMSPEMQESTLRDLREKAGKERKRRPTRQERATLRYADKDVVEEEPLSPKEEDLGKITEKARKTRVMLEGIGEAKEELGEEIFYSETGITEKERAEWMARLESELAEARRLSYSAGKPEEYHNLLLMLGETKAENMDPIEALPTVQAFNQKMLEEVRGTRTATEKAREDLRKRISGRKSRMEQLLEVGKGMAAVGTGGVGLGARAAPALVPSRQKDLSLYAPKPKVDLYVPPTAAPKTAEAYAVSPPSKGATRLFAVPQTGFQRTMDPEMHTGVGLKGLRIGFARGISTPEIRTIPVSGKPTSIDFGPLSSAVASTTVDKELLVPMGWSREMGLAWQEIKENGDRDTAEHVKEELEKVGVPKARTAVALGRLKRKREIVGIRQPGEKEETLVITGMMTPSEKQPGKYGFRGTGRYKMRKR